MRDAGSVLIERWREQWIRNRARNRSDLVVILGADSSIQYVSPSVERILGYGAEDLLGASFPGLIHPEDFNEAAGVSADGGGRPAIRLRHRDGSWRRVREVANDPLGSMEVRGLVFEGVGTDEDGQPDGKRGESDPRFEDAFERAPIGMALVSIGGRPLRTNRALCEIVGYAERDLRARTLRDLTYPEDRENDSDLTRRLLDGGIHAYRVEKRYLHEDGRLVWASLDVSLVRGLDGNPPYFVVQMQDITRRKAFEEELIHRASHDPLTGLANRALFGENLERALAYAQRHGKTVAVFFLDLDGFKLVNDRLGHSSGDLLLIEVANRLKALLRTEDTIARFGGDEFAVLLQDDASMDDLTQLAERMLQKLREPCVLRDTEMRITASIGIAPDISRENHPEDLLQKADAALYRAKSKGKDRHAMFEPEA